MIKNFKTYKPKIHSTAYIAGSSLVIGRVSIFKNASIWPGCVLRGDIDEIIIGENTNIQDGAIIHTNYDMPAVIGKGVTVGHGAVIHGSRINDNCLIGMGAVILDGAVIEENCIIAAGALVTEGKRVKSGSLVMGVPGKTARTVTEKELNGIKENVKEYLKLAKLYKNNK